MGNVTSVKNKDSTSDASVEGDVVASASQPNSSKRSKSSCTVLDKSISGQKKGSPVDPAVVRNETSTRKAGSEGNDSFVLAALANRPTPAVKSNGPLFAVLDKSRSVQGKVFGGKNDQRDGPGGSFCSPKAILPFAAASVSTARSSLSATVKEAPHRNASDHVTADTVHDTAANTFTFGSARSLLTFETPVSPSINDKLFALAHNSLPDKASPTGASPVANSGGPHSPLKQVPPNDDASKAATTVVRTVFNDASSLEASLADSKPKRQRPPKRRHPSSHGLIPAGVPPKAALYALYNKTPGTHVLTQQDYYTWHDDGPGHELKWTSLFLCPVDGHIFLTGALLAEQQPDAISPQGIVWYKNKKWAEHAAAAAAYEFCCQGRDNHSVHHDSSLQQPNLAHVPANVLERVKEAQQRILDEKKANAAHLK